jgi:hypothetical protein
MSILVPVGFIGLIVIFATLTEIVERLYYESLEEEE